MNRKQDQRQQTHDEILAAARRLFRADGYKPTGIGQIMDSIGLTVGGFYNHFESKDALFREVVDRTINESTEVAAAGETDSAQFVRRIANQYLSTEHRDDPAGGCLLPALSAEVARADEDVRAAYTRSLTHGVDKMSENMVARDGRSAQERAWAVTALSVGGLLLSRAVNDEALSQCILAACRETAEQI